MSHGFKRPFVSNSSDPKGRGKWQKTTPASHSTPLEWPPGAIVFRVICPNSKCGSVIGKGGTIISRIRQETGTQVKLEDKVPGCDRRVVVIIGSEKGNTTSNEHKDGNDMANVNKDGTKANKNDDEDNREKEKATNLESSKASEKELSLVQKALILVFERIIEREAESNPDSNEDETRKSFSVTIELLIIQSQVGYLLGKGGNVVKKIKSDSGAIITLLPADKIPACASFQDAVVQIPVDGLLPAQDGLLRVLHRIAISVPGDNVLARLIVSSNQVGCVLGKGGSVISEMRKLSGANIRLLSKDQTPPCVSDYEELVQVTGELGNVQNALLQITNKLKDHCFRMMHGGHPPFTNQMPPPPFDSHFGRRDFSPPRMFPDPPFHNEFRDHSYEERPPFPHGLHVPVQGLERMPPAPWEHRVFNNV